MSDQVVASFFDSLHFYYDYGCVRSLEGVHACSEPGVMLRWLYSGLLPCIENNVQRTGLASCVSMHSRFEPDWAKAAMSSGFVEIEHRAVGFAVRTAGSQMTTLLSDGEPCNASAFLDAGVASMWYTVRRGSGIFYRLGRVKMAPGKTAMVAQLLQEIGTKPTLAAMWPAIATRSNLFPSSDPSHGASADAERIQSVANGSASCVDAKLQPCRCRYVLHDTWDDAMIWMARALGYETLFITATLLCNQPIHVAAPMDRGGGATNSGNALPGQSYSQRGFATAYPEIVDVRPLSKAMTHAQARGVHDYLLKPTRSSDHETESQTADLHTWRKRPEVADAWIRQMQSAQLLTLRDPFDVQREDRAWPCRFLVNRWTLQCADHVSSRWPNSSWARCGIVACGFTFGGANSRSRHSSRHNSSSTVSDAQPDEL